MESARTEDPLYMLNLQSTFTLIFFVKFKAFKRKNEKSIGATKPYKNIWTVRPINLTNVLFANGHSYVLM